MEIDKVILINWFYSIFKIELFNFYFILTLIDFSLKRILPFKNSKLILNCGNLTSKIQTYQIEIKSH